MPHILKTGDSVFAIFSRHVPQSYMAVAMRTISELGLVPLAYYGLERLALGMNSSVHTASVDDYYKSQAVYIVATNITQVTLKEGGILVDDIKSTRDRGVAVRLHLIHVGTETSDVVANQLFSVKESIAIEIDESIDEFTEKLRADLLGLMGK